MWDKKKSELESFEGKEMVVEGTQVVAKNYYDEPLNQMCYLTLRI